MPTLAEIYTFPSISFLRERIFSFFRRKMDRTNPSEMDIKLLIPALTSHFTKTAPFLNWKMEEYVLKT